MGFKVSPFFWRRTCVSTKRSASAAIPVTWNRVPTMLKWISPTEAMTTPALTRIMFQKMSQRGLSVLIAMAIKNVATGTAKSKQCQYPQWIQFWRRKKDRKEDNTDVATSINYGVASDSSWSNSLAKRETGITRIVGTWKITATWVKDFVHSHTHTMIGWSIGGRVHQKVTHPSTILALGRLNLGVPMGSGLRLWA